MKKQFQPFSNATDAMNWQFNNCDKCKRSGCHAKKAIDMGFITGEISQKIAEYIGLNEQNRLVRQCTKFTDQRPVTAKKPIKDNYSLF